MKLSKRTTLLIAALALSTLAAAQNTSKDAATVTDRCAFLPPLSRGEGWGEGRQLNDIRPPTVARGVTR